MQELRGGRTSTIIEDRGFSSGCWIWQGATNSKGYGIRRAGEGRRVLVHRAAYEQFFGHPLHSSIQVHHRCEQRRCCNPEHLRPYVPRARAVSEVVASVQLFPPLDDATEAALRASIERFGVLVPVVKDQAGRILDGHHRVRIADALGVEYEVHVRDVEDDAEAREIARTLSYPASQPKPPAEQTNGRRGFRKNRSQPFEITKQRHGEYARAQLGRIVDGLSEINGLCRGLREVDLPAAAAASTKDDMHMWAQKAGELSAALRDLKNRLQEVQQDAQ